MTTPTPTDFEDQLTRALRHRADPVTAADGARAAIDHRIAQRTRARRTRRVGLAAVAVIVLLAGAFAVAQRGHDDASVVTGPDTPAVDFPHLVVSGRSTAHVVDYVPGRQVELAFVPDDLPTTPGDSLSTTTRIETGRSITESTTAQIGSVSLRMTISDAALADVARSLSSNEPGEPSSVGPLPALFVPGPAVGRADGGAGVLAWNPAPGIVAQVGVAVATSSGTPIPEVLTQLVAVGLVEIDDAAWEHLIDPTPDAPRLGLVGGAGYGEIRTYSPGNGTGFDRLVQVLDTPGFPPGTFQLTADHRADPDTFDAVDDPDHVDVRGTSGLISSAPTYLATAYGYDRSLSWVEDGVRYELAFTADAEPGDAVEVAGRLAVLTPGQWHALLFPTSLRTDLLPMPEFRPLVGPPPEGPVESTVLSVPSSPPATGG